MTTDKEQEAFGLVVERQRRGASENDIRTAFQRFMTGLKPLCNRVLGTTRTSSDRSLLPPRNTTRNTQAAK